MRMSELDDAREEARNASCCTVPMSRLTNEMSEIKEIAEGSFGVVKSYRHDFDENEYAVKQTKRTICGESNLQQQLQEIYALSSFPHRHIVRYFDGWVEDSAVFVRIEKLDVCVATLPRPVKESVLRDMLHQIASALYELHSHNVVHMDVKPENILKRQLSANEYIFKLCDFGLARPIKVKDMPTGEQFVGLNDDDGDRRYMSPELLTNVHDVVGTPADIYSLGKTCEAMMTTHPAEDGAGSSSSGSGGGQRQSELYSAAFLSLVQSMLAEDPQCRPTAFDVVQATLPEHLRDNAELLSMQRQIEALRAQLAEEDGESGNENNTSYEHAR
jgi:serine/threonine protein kinase